MTEISYTVLDGVPELPYIHNMRNQTGEKISKPIKLHIRKILNGQNPIEHIPIEI